MQAQSEALAFAMQTGTDKHEFESLHAELT